jgi:hypothetical protein
MKNLIIILAAIVFIILAGVSVTKLTVHDIVNIDPQLSKEIVKGALIDFDNPFERAALLLGKCRITSAMPPFSAEAQCFTLFRIPIGVLRGQPDLRMGVTVDIDPNSNKDAVEEVEKLNKAEEAIKKFTGKPNLELQYAGYNNNPSNFQIGKTSGIDKGVFVMKPVQGWDRPVYVFQQKEFINSSCEVYEYEVNAETFQVIEIHSIKPKWFRMDKDDCSKLGSMNWPLKTKEEIEQAVFAVMKNDPEHTSLLLRSDIQPEYLPLSKGDVKTPAASEWRWEDKKVDLPEGLDGDPWQHPIIRIIMSAGGKLMLYLNTTDLFNQ